MIDDAELTRLVREATPSLQAPESLHEWARAQSARVSQSAQQQRARRGVSPRWQRALYAAGLVAAAVLGFASRGAVSRAGTGDALAAQLVDEHVQSLMSNHLMDVVSTDQHTVKPWFAGRVDFAPRVVQLDSVGFPLLGGRVAYVDGHVAGALVYGRRKHVINLFMWREPGDDVAPSPRAVSGYSLLQWRAGGVHYCAVSDAAPAELRAFHAAFVAP